MFAQARRWGSRTPGALGESPGGGDLRVRSCLRMVDHIPEAPGRQMRINEGFTALKHCPGGNAVRLQKMHGLIVLTLLCPGHQYLVELGLVMSTCEHSRKSRILGQVGLPYGSAQPAPFVVGADGDGDPHIV